MRKLILLFLFLVSISVQAQKDTSSVKPKKKGSKKNIVLPPDSLDKLSPEDLLKYYQNEKPPFSNYKGPEKIGDSLFSILNPQVIPTSTVNGPSLYRAYDPFYDRSDATNDTTNNADQKLRPKIALGVGRLSYWGGADKKHFQSLLTSRPAFDLNISQRLTRYLQLNFNFMVGQIGAQENQDNRHENFQAEIRSGGLNLMYDFGNFIPDRYSVRPYISFGVSGFEFLSKTDLKDANGTTYNYWSDGSIKDKAEGAPDAQFAKDIKRDYTYETDVRERNKDGFGKYFEAAVAFPVGMGAVAKVTDRVDLKLNFQMFFTATKHLSGFSDYSSGNGATTKRKDNFVYTSIALQYDLVAKPRQKQKLHKDTLGDKYWLAFEAEDTDKDGVTDLKDNCQGTPEGVKVDANGCPLDDDQDGVPNYRDDELATAKGTPVNEKGVGQTDDYWKEWYARFNNDTTGNDVKEEYVGGALELDKKNTKLGSKRDLYTVELVRYNGNIPTDEMAFLLSIGDIKSLTLDDGTTVVYIAGEYRKLKSAIKRRDEFRGEGIKTAIVSRIKGNNVEKISDDELAKLLAKQDDDDLKTSTVGNNTLTIGTNTGAVGSNTGAVGSNTAAVGSNTAAVGSDTAAVGSNTSTGGSDPIEETFNKSDIVYRVQLGAFKNKISTSVFNTNAGVLELKTGDASYRYVTRGYKTIGEAASVRADLVIQGYSDAFVTAYKEGKRIPMSQTGATVNKNYKEDMNENKMFSSVDKKLVQFKIQLGALKKPAAEAGMDERVKDLPVHEKQSTSSGSLRYIAGKFGDMNAAEKYRKELEDKGFTDAFIIATFKDQVISIQEALELLK